MQRVRLDVWRVATRDVLVAMTTGRRALAGLRRDPAVTFAMLLGTSTDAFTPRHATPTRWALLTCATADERAHVGWWDEHARERATLHLRPLWARGSWGGRAPFVVTAPAGWDGPVVAVTRARLRARRTARFYRAVPPVAAALATADGCRAAFGIGERPLLRQGTVSIWSSPAALHAFAHGAPAHAAVVAATPAERWYAEELFARFALDDASGTLDGMSLA
jgi:hypothetical protein